jgi:uncharacterized protein YqgC (DUF456 family)
MTEQMKLTLKRIVGILLIVVGILGMILPIMPGVWLIPVGLQLLGWRLVINRKKSWLEMIKLKRRKKT